MDILDILSRYTPLKFDHLIANRIQKNAFKEFLRSVSVGDSCRIVVGASGNGKTIFCTLAFQEYDYKVIRPCYNDFHSHKEFTQYIDTILRTVSITDLVNKQRKVLFLDDVEVLMSQDRLASGFITTLIADFANGFYGNSKLVMTCTNGEERKLSCHKKKTTVIKLTPPPLNDCLLFVMDVLDKEGFEVDELSLIDLIRSMQCNLRNIFQNISTCVDIDEEQSYKQYEDASIFEIVQTIFANAEKGFDELDIALSSDPTLISFMLYDNVKDYVRSNYTFDDDTYKKCFKNVLQSYVIGSIFEAEMYQTNEWSNLELANLVKCGSVRCMQNALKRHHKTHSNIAYTTVLTRSSQHYCNMKRMLRYASVNEADMVNIPLLCEIAFENLKNSLWKNIAKQSEEGSMFTSFFNNICSRNYRLYSKRLRKQLNCLPKEVNEAHDDKK